jgi:hypothetical protein
MGVNMRTVIGYDLDGVICADVQWDGDVSKEAIDKLHQLRDQMYPTFYPSGDFVIITGRPEEDESPTWKWLNKYEIGPHRLHMATKSGKDWGIDHVIYHKARWISHYASQDEDLRMVCFIESDWNQVVELKKLCPIPVYHFGTQLNLYFEEFRL